MAEARSSAPITKTVESDAGAKTRARKTLTRCQLCSRGTGNRRSNRKHTNITHKHKGAQETLL